MTTSSAARELLRRWRAVSLGVILGLIAAIIYLQLVTPVYDASAQIFVSSSAGGSAVDLAQGNSFAQARVQSYTSLVTSPEVVNVVSNERGGNPSSSDIAAHVSADAPVNKILINVRFTSTNASVAADIANAVANQLCKVVSNLEAVDNSTPVRLTVTQPATVPSSPSSPNVPLTLAAGLAVGLLLGVGGASGRAYFDNTIKTESDVVAALRDVSPPLLAAVPYDKSVQNGDSIAFRSNNRGSRAEAFRQLRANIAFLDVDHPPRVIAVTSAMPGEGKSHVAMNLAAAFAEDGETVCLVETDLRRPSIGHYLGLVETVGLTNALVDDLPVESVLQNAGHNLAVLTAGPLPPNPSELLRTEQMVKLLEYMRESVTYIILDTAPLIPVADSVGLAALADTTLVTVRPGKTTRQQLVEAVDRLSRVRVTVGGLVFNGQRTVKLDQYYGYGYTGDKASESGRPVEASSD